MKEAPEAGVNPPTSLILANDVRLAADLRVSSLSEDDREAIRRACEFKQKGIGPEETLRPLTYALIRDIGALDDDGRDWRGRLELALALSRLVRASTLGLEVWGQGSRGLDGVLNRISVNYGASALKAPGAPWWLMPADWEDVARLLGRLDAGTAPTTWLGLDDRLCPRVANAVRLMGKAAFQDTAQLRYLVSVPALEGMVVQGARKGVGRVFRERLLLIADELHHPIAKGDLTTIYDHRSSVAHEGMFRGQTPTDVIEYSTKLDRLLAAILRRCIEDPGFCKAFESPGSVQDRWPVRERSYCDASMFEGATAMDNSRSCLLVRAEETGRASRTLAQEKQ
jgi:hypothetical protein